MTEQLLGTPPDGWRYLSLGEVCALGGGSVQTGPFGSQLHASDYVPVGVPSIMPTNIGENRVVANDIARVSEEDAERLSKYRVQPGDIVYSRRGDVEKRALISEREAGWLCGTGCLRVRFGDGAIEPRYATYYLAHPEVRKWIVRHAQGATMPNLNTSILSECPFLAPPLGEQRAIAHILGTLDDKIELNRRMSRTLEEMARALFKSWFVDFDPVRAKIDGRWKPGHSLPGLPADLYDLFPDRLVESELGEIPEGWEVAAVGDDLDALVSGSRPRGGAVLSGVPSVGAENVAGFGQYDYSKEKFIPEDHFKRLQQKGADVRPGDVLLYKDGAKIGRKTYFDCGFPHARCAVNEHVLILRTKSRQMRRFLYFWLDLPWMTYEIISLNSNSAQPGINQTGVKQLPLLRPTNDAVHAFDDYCGPLTDLVFGGCLESRTLAALRNSLLPRLISGELSASDLGTRSVRVDDPQVLKESEL